MGNIAKIETTVRQQLGKGTIIGIDASELIRLLIDIDNETYFYAYARGYNEGYKHGERGEGHAYPDTRNL